MSAPIALQLYTLRDLMAQEFSGTLERVAKIGYLGVETAFFSDNITLSEAARAIQDLGLTVVAAHTEIPLGDDQATVLTLAETFDCRRIIWHGWPQAEEYNSIDGTKRLAERYNQANLIAQDNGLSFGLHNHWWEFGPVDGQYRYQVLLDSLDPGIFFEIDTYWVKTAGLDPVAIVAELGSRAPLLHLKDGPAHKDQPMVALGDGVMDFPAICQAAGDNAEWLIVEMDDCATDMLTAVEKSYRYLIEHGLAHGK